ncbi:NYN domain-containing protein [Hydrogenophaga sp. Root209]|uniref:NYN domain-containing protein n=1 Tax=Hydrogenophaga sp. Root209 TaxID=1736490 RepID=UPI001F36EDAA|nr:NYN domain-containing protein [Hydrogenophaga sp. Root209]
MGRFGHIGTVIIIGGDSDYMPVAQKIKAAGRTFIGIGNRKNTNKHWAKSCHEFRYYESLVEQEASAETGPDETPDPVAETPANQAADLLRRAVHLLADSKGEPWVNKATVLPMVKRLDLTFDPKDHGHASFAELLKSMDAVIELRKGETDHKIRLRCWHPTSSRSGRAGMWSLVMKPRPTPPAVRRTHSAAGHPECPARGRWHTPIA